MPEHYPSIKKEDRDSNGRLRFENIKERAEGKKF